MIPHHESAIDMAKVAERQGKSTFVKRLAGDIVHAQDAEISKMRRIRDQLPEVDRATSA